MGTVFFNLPVPTSNGAGASVNVAAAGAPKAIVVSDHAKCLIEIQTSNDNVHWHGLVTLSSSSQGFQDLPRACIWMRAVVSAFQGGVPQVNVGSTNDATALTALAVPPGAGSGAPSNTAALLLYKTIQVGGQFRGTVFIEVSEDGSEWATVATFNNPGVVTLQIPTSFMRVTRTGKPSGVPIVTVASTNPPGGSSGPGSEAEVNVENQGVAIPNNPHMTLNFTGPGVTATDAGGGVADITIPGADVNVENQGVAIPNNPHPILNFVGPGVTATDAGGGVADITIPGADVNIQNQGVAIPNNPHPIIDFIGAGVTASDQGGGVAGVTIPGFVFVFMPAGIQTGNVYSSFAALVAAKALAQGVKYLQFSNSMQFLPGGTLVFAAGTMTYTAPLGSPAIPATVVGQAVVLTGAVNPGNNGQFFVATRTPTQITFANAAGVTESPYQGAISILGGFPAIIPAAGMPAGGWDMTETEWCGFTSPVGLQVPNQTVQFGGAPSGGDVQFRNLDKIGGDLTINSLNVALPAVVIPPGGVTIEVGVGFTGDTPNINNNGTAPFWDNSVNSNTLTCRLDGRIGGTFPAFNAGNANYSPNPTVAFQFKGNARLAANMVTGTNVAALLNFGAFNVGTSWGRQQNWAGSIVEPNTLWTRALMTPASLNQASPIPSAIPLVFPAFQMNSLGSLDATAADITQTLPLIRAAAPATGAAPGAVAGVNDATGMTVWVDNAKGTHNILVVPSAVTPDTFEDGSTVVVVPPGYVFAFMNDGISKWKILTARNVATAPALLVGPGSIDITHQETLFSSTAPGNAIVLPNGQYKGQSVTIIHSTVGGAGDTGIVTPATPGGNFVTFTMTLHWDNARFTWDGAHWNAVQVGTGPGGLA